MTLTMQLSGRFADGQVHTYVVALPRGGTAFLIWVCSNGWELTIRHEDGQIDRRGVFATTEVIMAHLETEFSTSQPLPTSPHAERRLSPRTE